jgi:hypothetical protein
MVCRRTKLGDRWRGFGFAAEPGSYLVSPNRTRTGLDKQTLNKHLTKVAVNVEGRRKSGCLFAVFLRIESSFRWTKPSTAYRTRKAFPHVEDDSRLQNTSQFTVNQTQTVDRDVGMLGVADF